MLLDRLMRAAPWLLALALVACGTAPRREQEVSDSERKPTGAEINVSLGQSYLEKGQYEIAMEKLQRALRLDPKLASAHTVIAVLYERINNPEQAEYHYKRASELAPKSGAVLNNYGTFVCARSKYDEADKLFQRALQDPFYSTPAVAHANRGACALRSGHAEIAEDELRKALAMQPNMADALFQMASLQTSKPDYFRARAFLQRYEAQTKPSAEALALGLKIETGAGNVKAARDYRNRLLSEFPDSDQAQNIASSESTQ